MKQFLETSKNGKSVWFDDETSHTATHFNDAPGLADLCTEIIRQTSLIDDYYQFHTDLGRIVGLCDMVSIEPGDDIVYTKRLNRDTYTVFNKSKQSTPSSLVTTAFARHDDDSYELQSAWIGPSDSPSMPGTERETIDSKDFWSRHALVWGSQQVQPGTETSECPW